MKKNVYAFTVAVGMSFHMIGIGADNAAIKKDEKEKTVNPLNESAGGGKPLSSVISSGGISVVDPKSDRQPKVHSARRLGATKNNAQTGVSSAEQRPILKFNPKNEQ
jgi:hypothetical protein